ncbi:peptidoglycan-binding domain-containing protein [Paenibacillus turpanensis]|uniref:peptidoglycan-binding domain-containing protein n=1 Tax=Paenibacillus turpanensis TaxID=2689078 RepID=UPI001FB5DCEF|nr:peptidoglycan-binding domain-containing protein [Paenibacillus turpanensis]
MKMRKKVFASFVLTGVMMAALSTSAFAQYGTNGIAAVGTSALNSKWGTNFQSTYSLGQTHAQIGVLKENLKKWRSYNPSLFTGVQAITSTSNYFDQATKDNLIVFQKAKGLTADGIYGAASRNAMHASMGVSPKGWVRIANTSYYINYNDTKAGLAADAAYKLDHSWVTTSTKSTLDSIAKSFYSAYSKKLEINDASLMDGYDTPEHATHMDGKSVDVRNKFGTTAMTAAQEKKFLELAVANPNVKEVLFYKNHGLTSAKIKVRADHADHFHLTTVN